MLSEWKIEPGTKRRIRLGNLSAMADGGSISEPAQWPETTVLVPVGSIRTVEFIANNPADWAIHCHMTHHVMNQMGHRLPNIVGIEPGKLDKQVRASCPATCDGAGRHGGNGRDGNENPAQQRADGGLSRSVRLHHYGGMRTNVKVRQDLGDLRPDEGKDFSYGGWYENPPGTQAISATEDELHRDLGGVPKSKRTPKPMHHSTMGEGKRDESLLAREALQTSNDCYLEPLRAGY